MTATTYSATAEEYAAVRRRCRDIFEKKLYDYGLSWRIMRPESITDQILIKAMRIRSIQEKGEAMVNEGIEPEFIGIINYGVIALIQLQLGAGEALDPQLAMTLYDEWLDACLKLMEDKNHDYDEAWRLMRVSSITDIILQKLLRTREIEEHKGITKISEGVGANYMDMVNYSFFALILLAENEES